MTFHAITFADVILHLGIGGVFLCTSKCADRWCPHKTLKSVLLTGFMVFEAIAITAVAG